MDVIPPASAILTNGYKVSMSDIKISVIVAEAADDLGVCSKVDLHSEIGTVSSIGSGFFVFY